MKILLISGIYPPDIGGPATYLPEFAEYLSDLGISVTTLTLKPEKLNKPKSRKWREVFIQRRSSKILRFLTTVLCILFHGRKANYIFCNGLFIETSFANSLLRKKATVKIVGDPVWERFINRSKSKISLEKFNGSNLRLNHWIQRKVYNWAFSRFTHITTPGQDLTTIIKNWDKRFKISVISNGTRCIDLPEVVRDIDVLTVSRLVKWKNIDQLIKACAGLNLKLVIVGDGPENLKLRQLALGLGLEVTFTGEVAHSEVNNYMSRSKIFALLSDYEGLSIALIESMMASCRVLVSDIEANRSVIEYGKCGKVVNQKNVESVRNAIQSLSLDIPTNFELSTNARKTAINEYCWDRQFSKMLELIQK